MLEPELKQYCAKHDIRMERIGCAWRLTGRGISVLVADISTVTERDLQPFRAYVDTGVRISD